MKYERFVSKFGPSYIVRMMIVTRLGGLIGGAAVVYYVQLTLDLSGALSFHFRIAAAAVVLLAITATVLLALLETRSLRAVMTNLRLGHPFSEHLGLAAGREAVLFSVRHHLREAFIVPLCCLPPVYIYLTWAADASFNVLLHITIGAFLGISCAVSLTYFIIERLMVPVVQHLTDYGVVIDYETIPTGRLQNRLLFCFTLMIVVTAVIIATLANQKVADLVNSPGRLNEVVASLRTQTILVSGCAVLMSVVLSTLLARSVTTRVRDMVHAMRRVEAGHLEERIMAISTDEIGMVGRSFNKMVRRLEHSEATIRELNTGLERKVDQRTRQLAESTQELQHSYEKLQEHDRLKTAFFSNISHELRTPLTLILAPVENLLEERHAPLKLEQRQSLQVVRRNTMRLLNHINDLLDFAKLEAGKATLSLSPTDVNELIDDLISAARVLANQRGIRLDFVPDPQVGLRLLDRAKIEKVVINLISNALKFTGKEGVVDVTTSLRGREFAIAVKDTGIGIAPGDQNKIYQRFVQIDGSTSRQYDGTGLGLPLAKEFVELHGGRIGLESELGKGSCFTIVLPAEEVTEPAMPLVDRRGATSRLSVHAEVDQLPAREKVRAPRVDDGCQEKILIVDDSAEILGVLATILTPDYQVIEAKDGEAALRIAAEEHPDIIISDVMMPRINGNELCARIKGNPETARIGFIMLTAKADLAMKIEGLQHGADDYLYKPFNGQELRARVGSLLRLRKLDRQLQTRNEELEKLVEELERTQEHLVHSEKMSSLGQLAAGIAHEINNAINAVYNGILPLRAEVREIQDMVSREGARCGKVADGDSTIEATPDAVEQSFALVNELAEVVEIGARRTADIVTGLKKFAHPGGETTSVFDVHEGLDVALNLLSNKLKGHIEVHREYCQDGRVSCSGSQLTQVFLNLLDNALQAISGKGDIYVTTERVNHELVVRVRDTGEGIPSDLRRRIFDPFFTTKEVGIGTGLGLSISYGIVTGAGGSISVASPPPAAECGTEFTVALPTGDGCDQHEPQAGQSATAT